ncbi:MAG: HD domain-containing protein, partial [Candidatus Dormibacteraeota bacterium]|nr:HD domain-containing protein [Candidatus Dormibacteraeota bacterium]
VRDARAANVPYGMVDVERLINSFAITCEAGGSPLLAVDPKGVAALQSLVFAKYLMFATVYWHHACRSAVAMLLRALQEGLRRGSLEAPRLERADDASLIALLRSPAMPPLTRELAQRLLERRLYKRAVELEMEEPGFAALDALWERPQERSELEARWEEELGLQAASILIDIPEPKALAAELPSVLGGGRSRAWDQASGLGSADLVRLERRARRIRLFAADHQLAERVRNSWPDLMGQLSHFG